MNVANINVISRGFEVQSDDGETLGFSECILDANRLMHDIPEAMRVVRVPDGAVCTRKAFVEGAHFWSKFWRETA